MFEAVVHFCARQTRTLVRCGVWRWGPIALGLWFVVGKAEGQPVSVSLQDAIEIGLGRHPRLLNATAAIDRCRASRKEAWEVAPIEATYSWGQLNGRVRNDYQWTVSQSFGSLLTPVYKNALVNLQIATGTLYRKLVEKEVIAEIRRAWAYYQYCYNMLVLYRAYGKITQRMEEASRLRYEQGEITLFEKNMVSTLNAEMTMLCMQASEELQQSVRRFEWSCYAERPVVPNDTALTLFNVPLLPTADKDYELSGIQVRYLQGVLAEKQEQIRIERSRFFPELSFGYINQKIAPLAGLDAWMVGISFPLFFTAQKSRVRQARIDAQIARNETDAGLRELRNKVMDLQSRLRQRNEQIRYYLSGALPEAESLLKSANQQFGESKIDVSGFVQSLTSARQLQQGYIEAVYQYNEVVVELELYTDNGFNTP